MRSGVTALCLLAMMRLHAQAPAYHITHAYAVGGEGGWDYLVPDAPNHRVFIGRRDRVMVVDETSGKLLGEVPDIHGAHGTAIDAGSGHGFATSGNDSSVVMFDLTTYRPLARIHAAEDADAIIYDPVSRRVFSGCRSGVMAISDYRAGKVVATVPIGAGVDGAKFEPPQAGAPSRRRPPMVPGSFAVLVVERQ